jgi:phage terminase small subunit
VADLTNKQKAFIEEYLKDFNATRAAERAGYRGNDATLGAIGYENLRKPQIAERVSHRLRESAMTADEVLMRLSEQARADISEFLKEYGAIDWDAVDKKGHLVKKITHTKGKQSIIEIYDAQSALSLLGRAHGLFKDKVEHSGKLESDVTITDKGRDRAISSLADAIATAVRSDSEGGGGAVDAAE